MSKLTGKKLLYINKDRFVYGKDFVEIKWFCINKIFTLHSTIKFINKDVYYINDDTVIDISNGLKVIKQGKIIHNIFGTVINGDFYTMDMKNLGKVDRCVYNFIVIIEEHKSKRQYTIYNNEYELLHTFPYSTSKIKGKEDGDFYTFIVGRNKYTHHKNGVSDVIAEANS